MNLAVDYFRHSPTLSEQEYFALEQKTSLRHEFINGEVYAIYC